MKPIAGMALIGATLLAGCMDNTSGGTQAEPAVMTTRAEQAAYLSQITESFIAATPTGQASFTGLVADADFMTDNTSGISGKVVAGVNFDSNTISMQLSDFNSATASVAGNVSISASWDETTAPGVTTAATVTNVEGTYAGQDVTSASMTTAVKEGTVTNNNLLSGAIMMGGASGGLFSGSYFAYQDVN